MTSNPTPNLTAGAWTPGELDRIGRADELRVASYRPDGTLRPYTIIWVARHEGDIYVRSAHGPENGWFRRARQAGRGRIQVTGLERDVLFQTPPQEVHEGLDSALHAKYDRYGPGPVGAITGEQARPGTLRVLPLRTED